MLPEKKETYFFLHITLPQSVFPNCVNLFSNSAIYLLDCDELGRSFQISVETKSVECIPSISPSWSTRKFSTLS